MTGAELERAAGAARRVVAALGGVLTTADIARRFDVHPQLPARWTRDPEFPEPLAGTGAHREACPGPARVVWLAAEVDAYVREHRPAYYLRLQAVA